MHYSVVPTPLGFVLLAGSNKGLQLLYLGDSAAAALATGQADYPNETWVRDETALAGWQQEVREYFAGTRHSFTIPLDVQGTPFQLQVWESLRAIPAGETRTYQQIATAIGKPRAVRAVGSACGNNPVSLVIPCHRAVRSDGRLGGYRWGLTRKETLLQAEKRAH